jgi:NADPH2:quinone reductase
MKAIGLNYADIYRRKGNYHLAVQPPYILGYEGAGIIEEVAEDVLDYRPGDRVGFADVLILMPMCCCITRSSYSSPLGDHV